MAKVSKDKDSKVIEIEATPREVEETKAVLQANTNDKVRIIISEQEGDENQGDVILGLNGKFYQIKRGFPVEIPKDLLEVLNHAVITKMTQNMATQEITYKDVPRFAYQVLS